jgi:2,3-bisphosphoglycerate-dependent phosphoglycerate mutase
VADTYRLVLLRHGQSTWNLENRFTGWVDVPLTDAGAAEAMEAGGQMRDAGLHPDVVHTSVLLRAIQTANVALEEMGRLWIPVRRSWRLNERHYGGLTGLNKAETAARHGEEQVKVWRRSYDVPPPPVDRSSEYHPANDERYRFLPEDVLPATECLKDVVVRMLPYWYDAIVPDLRAGGLVLVAAHGNSLRALVKHLDGLSDDEVTELNIPTGVPRVYELDAGLRPLGWRYLGDPDEVARKAEAVAQQGAARQG